MKKTHRITIYGTLPDYNAMLEKAANPSIRKKGNNWAGIKGAVYQSWKNRICQMIALEAKSQLRDLPSIRKMKEMTVNKIKTVQPIYIKIAGSFSLVIRWYCPNRMKDPDNISHAVKYILDGLQEGGIIENDGWDQVSGGILHQFAIDPVKPRVEIYIMEGFSLDLEVD